ncbi:MAG: hypothetical protein KAS87_00665 [Candidatus Omnitrophica bacterium]|nr:hypothetical protein [Candidatus Omnitrophota bacterium]
MIVPVFVEDAQATYNKANLTDITSTSQKIAPDGESNLAVIKVEMTASEVGTEYTTLRYIDIDLAQISGTFEAGTINTLTGVDLANIANSTASGVSLYQDSGSTSGSFDSDDGRLPIDVANGTTDIALFDSSGYAAANTARLVFGADGVGGPTISTNETSPSVFYVVLRTHATGSNDEVFTATVSDVRYYDNVGPTEYTATVAPTSFVTRNITLGNDNVAPSVSKIEIEDISPDGVIDRAKVYFNESMSDAVTSSARWYVQNATTDTGNSNVTAYATPAVTVSSATKFLAGEYAALIDLSAAGYDSTKQISSKSGNVLTLAAGFTTAAVANDLILEVPVAAPVNTLATAATAAYSLPVTAGTGTNFHVGDYIAVVDVTGVATAAVLSTARIIATAANTLTLDTATIASAAGDVVIEIAGYTLAATGAWSTTTNVNDTFTINIENFTLPYSGVTLNFGYYNASAENAGQLTDGTLEFKDSTGTVMSETSSMTTTDKAKPYAKKAYLYDHDGNGKVDELRVTFSEPLDTSSVSTGFALKNTTLTPDKTYTLTGVNGFIKGAEAYSEAGDTIKMAIQEESSDVSDAFTLNYTEGSSQVVDSAGNDAISVTQIGAANVSMAITPVVTKIEVKDADFDGKIDAIEVTCSCALTEVGSAENDFSVSGYAKASASVTATKVFTIVLTEGSVYDTDVKPDVTYTNDGITDGDYLHCGDTSYVLENVTGDMITEADKAAPILISQTLYETDSDDVWDSGETVQLFFSEGIDPSSIATSWSGDVFGDFSNTGLGAADSPDSGLMSVDGKVVTLTASENATGTLTTSDHIRPVTNEVKDVAGNSARDNATATFLIVTPTTAPTVDQINTLDENDNGVVDALAINFNGIINGSTIAASDFTAARGSNFSISTAVLTPEAATSTSPISPDLAISEIVTQNGGNDSTVIVRFTEVNEDTGAHPQVKYVEGALADLAGNKVATFNAYTSDNTKFETAITYDTKDKIAPKVMEIRLKDRNANNKYDQLMVTYSEAIRTDTGTIASASTNGVLSSTGWAVADHTIAASGYVYDNTNTALTYATTNAVFKTDINELSGSETAVPEVTYSASGITKDAWSNLLGAIAAGDITEVSEITDLTPELVDGDVARIGTAAEVYIIKIVGSNKYKRHIVSPEVFNSYGHLNWSAIKSVSDLNAYSLSAWVRSNTGPNETPAATDKVYEVNADSTMHWLNMTAAQFYARGGSDEAIYNVNSGELGLYTLGVDVMYE